MTVTPLDHTRMWAPEILLRLIYDDDDIIIILIIAICDLSIVLPFTTKKQWYEHYKIKEIVKSNTCEY